MGHLNEALDDVAGVEVADGLYELVESFIVLLFLIQVVCMLLANFSNDFLREMSIQGYLLGLQVKPFLE